MAFSVPFVGTIPITVDLTGILLLLGGAVFYFGKIIGDTQVEQYDARSYQLAGAMFTFEWILLPFLLLFGIDRYILPVLSWNVSAAVTVSGLFLIATVYVGQNRLNKFFRFDLADTERYFDRWAEGLESLGESVGEENLDKGRSVVGGDFVSWFTEVARFGRDLFGSRGMRFSASVLLAFFLVQAAGGSTAVLVASGVFGFIGYSGLAFATAYEESHCPHAIIRMEDGREIKGKIISFGDYITVWGDDQKYQLKEEQVADITQAHWKNEVPYNQAEPDSLDELVGLHGSFLAVDVERDQDENIEDLRFDQANWVEDADFERFEDQQVDLAIVYKFTDEDNAFDSDKLFKLVKPVVSSLEDNYADEDDRHIFDDDEQIKQILVRRQEASGGDRDRLTISFREHSDKPMKLVTKPVL